MSLETEFRFLIKEVLREVVQEQMSSSLGSQRATARNVSLKKFAELMGCGITKAREMVASGEVDTVPVGKRRMVPMTEVDRLCSVPPPHVSKAQAKVLAQWTPIRKS